MLAWRNADALAASLDRGEAIYWSRARQRLWHKGESSGHTQQIIDIRLDCDADTLLLLVKQKGGNRTGSFAAEEDSIHGAKLAGSYRPGDRL